MSRTYNKWKNSIKNYGHKTFDSKNRKYALSVAYVDIVKTGDTPDYKFGKPERDSASDRKHKLKKYGKRSLRRYYENETKRLINEYLDEEIL